MAEKPKTEVTGIVEKLSVPADWKDGPNGRFKRCGILLKDCNKEGTTWINYFWNEKDRQKNLLPNPFDMVQPGKRYSFECTTSVYQDKIQYAPVSYSLVGGGDAPAHTEDEIEIDEEIREPAPAPRTINPKFKLVGYLIQDANGNVHEVIA